MDYKISGERLTSIANAIRGKTGKEDSLTLEQMVTEIDSVVTSDDLPNAEDTSFGTVPTEIAEYKVQEGTMIAIADQVRRISGVIGELTPEQMENSLLNVLPNDELPKAENAAFGEANDIEYGYTLTHGTLGYSGLDRTIGYKFTVMESFAVVGLRIYTNGNSGKTWKLCLWKSDGTLLSSGTVTETSVEGWLSFIFDTPVIVQPGEQYVVSGFGSGNYHWRDSTINFNGKLTYVTSLYANGDTLPTSALTTMNYTPDIIVGKATETLPNEYQIERETLDDIAEEVQRITGATTKLSIAQIITALQGIEAQS